MSPQSDGDGLVKDPSADSKEEKKQQSKQDHPRHTSFGKHEKGQKSNRERPTDRGMGTEWRTRLPENGTFGEDRVEW